MQPSVEITTYSGLLVALVPALRQYLKRYANPKKEGRPWFRLVTCLGNKSIFMGGVPIYQTVVAAAVRYLQNQVSVQPWKTSSLASFGVGR